LDAKKVLQNFEDSQTKSVRDMQCCKTFRDITVHLSSQWKCRPVSEWGPQINTSNVL